MNFSDDSTTTGGLYFTPNLLPSRSSDIGVLTLNKPESLNALTLDMVKCVNSILPVWEKDNTLGAILIEGCKSVDGNNKKGKGIFCAGGDVKSLAICGMDAMKDGKEASDQLGFGKAGVLSSDFFREEYKMNYQLATSKLPQISILDGVCMGGGVGISIHGSYRVATENTLFAMPETAIGLFPDVGSLYWLSRLERKFPGIGVFLALTGWRLKADDLLFTGIATHFIDSHKIDEFKKVLIDGVKADIDVKILLDNLDGRSKTIYLPPKGQKSFLEKNMDEIKFIFASNEDTSGQQKISISLEEIFQKLSTSQTQFGESVYSHIHKMSPTSLFVTLEGLKRASQMNDIGEVLSLEYTISQGFMRVSDNNPKGSDFYEGIRALLIDKDRKPKWNPSSIKDIDPNEIMERYFNSDILETQLSFQSSPSSKL